ncbi:MAG: ABC transporter ATP-binding protein [Pseudomonadota bacterium]
MSALVKATGISKHFGAVRAVDDVSFEIQPGRIVGLIGPNGAGKTTLLKAVLGLTPCSGALSVCGLDPYKHRRELMHQVSYVADVSVLPRWIRVKQLLDFVETVHGNFSRSAAEKALARTKVQPDAKVKELSKGMVAQLHLSIIMAIDAKLLILDEPTLGLDILFRKAFYAELLGDYFDAERTIVITTHQVEEIENILTDVMFIDDGKLVLNASVEDISERYTELMATKEHAGQARALSPVTEREVFGKSVFTFEGVPRAQLEPFGEVRTPGLADLFVAKLGKEGGTW